MDCSGTIGKIHVVEIEVHQGDGLHAIMMDFMIWGHLARPQGLCTAQGSALMRNVARLGFRSGSKNLLQRGILYRHERI